MPITIDQANALQIRPSMVVNCSMALVSGISLLFYAPMAKLYDDTLGNDGYPMRKLADLQDEGFPLDNSCQLYDDTITPSETNGKLGLRTSLGSDGRIRIDGTGTIDALTIRATGSGVVRVGSATGTAYELLDGQPTVVPIGARSTTLYFQSDDPDRRIEVENINAGIVFEVTNENLISCNLNLRSDLQILNPSFPESEIEIVFAYPNDINEALVDIEEGVPIIYSAGYDGEMSPERYFYLTEEGAFYSDNTLTLHGLDAVYLLESDTKELYSEYWHGSADSYINMGKDYIFECIYYMVEKWLKAAGITLVSRQYNPYHNGTHVDIYPTNNVVYESKPAKEWLAYLINALHQDYPNGTFTNITSFWLTYVDAGRPTLRWKKPTEPQWIINEEDIANHTNRATRAYNKFVQSVTELTWSKRGGLPWASEGSFDPNGFSEEISMEYPNNNPVRWYTNGKCRNYYCWDGYQTGGSYPGAKITYQTLSFVDLTFHKPNTSIAERKIRCLIAEQAAEINKEITATTSRNGITGEIELDWVGDYDTSSNHYKASLYASKSNGSVVEILPGGYGMTSLFNRSRRTGSFTFKGDPRWQPRDVVQMNRLDGSELIFTIESINLKHENGGTTAEVNYREGIV